MSDLAYDADGFLYAPGFRDLLGWVAAPGGVVRCEVLFALGRLDAAPPRFDGLATRDPAHRVLIKLKRHHTGRSLDELALDPDDPVVDGLVRAGDVACAGGVATLTAQGHRAVDGYLRRAADALAPSLAGSAPDRLAVTRHAGLRIVLNRMERGRRQAAAVDAPWEAWPLGEVRSEDGLLYEPALREFLSALAADQVLRYETFVALRGASSGRRRFARGLSERGGPMPVLLRLRGHPDGLAVDGLAPGLERFLAEAEREGVLDRGTDPAGAAVVRLTDEGRRKLDAAIARLVDEAVEATDGVDDGHLAVLRDTCWRVVAAG